MAKILELESGVDPTPVEQVQDKMTETEKVIQGLMRKSYVLGVSSGMRTMCITVLSQLNDTKNMNPQKQLNLLRQMCKKNVEHYNQAMQSDNNATNANENTTNTEKENKNNV